jgi:hypothetical protein
MVEISDRKAAVFRSTGQAIAIPHLHEEPPVFLACSGQSLSA